MLSDIKPHPFYVDPKTQTVVVGSDDRRNEETPAVPVTVPQPVLGNLGEFDSQTNSIASYLKQMQLYFEANAMVDDRKVAMLLTVIGAKTYKTLRSLLAPE